MLHASSVLDRAVEDGCWEAVQKLTLSWFAMGAADR